MSLRGADASDSKNFDNALYELTRHKLNAKQLDTLKVAMNAWDTISKATAEEERDFFAHFSNNFALAGAITQIIHISKKYSVNDLVILQIKTKLGQAIEQIENDLMDKKITLSYKK